MLARLPSTISPFLLGMTFVASAGADPVTLVVTTAQSPFTPGTLNQGWYSPHAEFNADTNDNYLAAAEPDGEYRNFFTFDLSSVRAAVSSAVLEAQRHGSRGELTYSLFDVSTDPGQLNSNAEFDAAIFDDLGSGISFGSFLVPDRPFAENEILRFALNRAGIAGIRAARGGFFSLGGAVSNGFLFGGSQFTPVSLRLETDAAPIPEPGTLLLLGSGLAVLARSRPARPLRP